MQLPLTITFHHVDRSEAVEERVRELTARLEKLHQRITGCHVTIDRPTASRLKGAPFIVKVDVTLPGRELFTSNAHHPRPEHENVYTALHDVFDSAKRQLQGAVESTA